MVGFLDRLPHDLKLLVRRCSNIQDLDILIPDQFLPAVVDMGNTALPCHFLRLRPVQRRNGIRRKADIVICHEVAVPHDETRADAADAKILALGQLRIDPEVEFTYDISGHQILPL